MVNPVKCIIQITSIILVLCITGCTGKLDEHQMDIYEMEYNAGIDHSIIGYNLSCNGNIAYEKGDWDSAILSYKESITCYTNAQSHFKNACTNTTDPNRTSIAQYQIEYTDAAINYLSHIIKSAEGYKNCDYNTGCNEYIQAEGYYNRSKLYFDMINKCMEK